MTYPTSRLDVAFLILSMLTFLREKKVRSFSCGRQGGRMCSRAVGRRQAAREGLPSIPARIAPQFGWCKTPRTPVVHPLEEGEEEKATRDPVEEPKEGREAGES